MITNARFPKGIFDGGLKKPGNAIKEAVRKFSIATHKLERIEKKYLGIENTLYIIKNKSELIIAKLNSALNKTPGQKIPTTDRSKYYFEKLDYFNYRIRQIIDELSFEKEIVENYILELESNIEIVELEVLKLDKVMAETNRIRLEIDRTVKEGNNVLKLLKEALERMENNAEKIQIEITLMEDSINKMPGMR